jgi:hypothetical protein
LTLIRIFEELRGRGYDGGYDAVRHYARRWSQERGQAKLESDRAAFAAEKQEFYNRQSREQEQHQQKMAGEYQEHREHIAKAEQEIASRDQESRRKWNDLSKQLTTGLPA